MKPELVTLFDRIFAEMSSPERVQVRALLESQEAAMEIRLEELTDSLEIRMPCHDLEFRDDTAAKSRIPGYIGTLHAIPAKFNNPSKDFGGFKEVVMPSAFTRSLAIEDDFHDVRALHDHNKAAVLGRKSAGTLEIRADSVGIPAQIHLVDTSLGRDVLVNVKARNLDSMSFGFKPKKTKWSKGADGTMLRELHDVDLAEVSVVTWARYGNTELTTRDMQELRRGLAATTPRTLDRLKREQARRCLD